MDAQQLQTIANSRGRGYLKQWKAVSMIATMKSLPLRSDRALLRSWVANCLEMEGFDDAGIDAVADALMRSVEQGD